MLENILWFVFAFWAFITSYHAVRNDRIASIYAQIWVIITCLLIIAFRLDG